MDQEEINQAEVERFEEVEDSMDLFFQIDQEEAF
jgi:hypothetical protein